MVKSPLIEMWRGSGILLRRLRLKLTALFLTILMIWTPAMSDELAVDASSYEDVFAAIQTSCSAQRSREIAKELSVTNLPIVFNGKLGAIGELGTSHGIGELKSKGKVIGLLISFNKDLDRCEKFLMFKRPLRQKSVKISSAFPKGSFPYSASSEEQVAFENLLKGCVSLGTRASSKFRDGGYTIVDGDIVNLEGGFDCASVAIRNSSSTSFVMDGTRIRISIFGGQIFIIGE